MKKFLNYIIIVLLSFILLWCFSNNWWNEKTYTEKLFQEKNPYIWDNSQVSKLLNELWLSYFWTYTIELQTKAEPYWLNIYYSEFLTEFNLEEFEKSIKNNSILLLSLIENLSYVEWEYKLNEKDEFKKYSLDDVNKIIWKNVKDFAKTKEDLQKLIDIVQK